MDFLAFIRCSLLVSGISYIFLIVGVAYGEWYITLLRTITYVLFIATILTAIAELVKLRKTE
jgi:hypothetical protein